MMISFRSGFRSLGRRRRLDQGYRDVACNGRDVALGDNLFPGLRGGKHELHLFGGGQRLRVGPYYDDLTDPAACVVNELPRGDWDGAERIDLHDDVVQPQAGSLDLGEGALLGIRPVLT